MNESVSPKTLLFFGELPPASVHGISLSNQLNIDLLRNEFDVVIIEESSDLQKHARFTWAKLLNLLKYVFLVAKHSVKTNFSYFYLCFSMSTIGVIKTFFLVVAFWFFNRSRVVLHMHRGDFFGFYENKINKIFSKIILRLASKIIVLSPSQLTDFGKVFTGQIEVLENSLPQEYFLGDKTFTNKCFVFLSNYILEKGILDLLEVFKVMSIKDQDLKLECYGSFSDDNLKETVYGFQSSNISINNAIYGEEKFEKIHNSYCLILPSWNEGQPLVLLEAMSQGTPVIATDVGLVKELLGGTYPYVYTLGNKKQLAQMIDLYLADTNKEKISVYLKNRYYERFSREKHKHELMKIFK